MAGRNSHPMAPWNGTPKDPRKVLCPIFHTHKTKPAAKVPTTLMGGQEGALSYDSSLDPQPEVSEPQPCCRGEVGKKRWVSRSPRLKLMLGWETPNMHKLGGALCICGFYTSSMKPPSGRRRKKETEAYRAERNDGAWNPKAVTWR